MAVDVQGADLTRPWVKKAGASFTTLVDRESKLAAQFGVKYVPFAIWLDETGRVVRGAQPVNVGKEAQRASIAAWLHEDNATAPATEEATNSHPADASDVEAELRFSLAAHLVQQGRSREALDHLRRALARDPDNWLIRKQIWSMEHPDRFYDGRVDFSWQREQLKKERGGE